MSQRGRLRKGGKTCLSGPLPNSTPKLRVAGCGHAEAGRGCDREAGGVGVPGGLRPRGVHPPKRGKRGPLSDPWGPITQTHQADDHRHTTPPATQLQPRPIPTTGVGRRWWHCLVITLPVFTWDAWDACVWLAVGCVYNESEATHVLTFPVGKI